MYLTDEEQESCFGFLKAGRSKIGQEDMCYRENELDTFVCNKCTTCFFKLDESCGRLL